MLPTEILNLILIYYTNDFRGLARFSTVCRQWRNIADFSDIWLICDFHFYSSNSCFGLFPPIQVLAEKEQRQSKIERGDKYPFILDLWSDFPRFPSVKFKIVVLRNETGPLTRNPLNTGSEGRSSRLLLRNDQSFQTLIKFMSLFAQFQRLWAWHVYWLPSPISLHYRSYLSY